MAGRRMKTGGPSYGTGANIAATAESIMMMTEARAVMTSVGVPCAVRDVVENLRAKAVSMCLETRMFMASPYWSMILVGLAPDAVGLDVGLITEPPVTDGRPAGASGDATGNTRRIGQGR